MILYSIIILVIGSGFCCYMVRIIGMLNSSLDFIYLLFLFSFTNDIKLNFHTFFLRQQ